MASGVTGGRANVPGHVVTGQELIPEPVPTHRLWDLEKPVWERETK